MKTDPPEPWVSDGFGNCRRILVNQPLIKLMNSHHSQKPASAAKRRSATHVDSCETLKVSQRAWRTGAAAILITGAFLRLYDLNLVPLHHDEGVNGIFLLHLVRD